MAFCVLDVYGSPSHYPINTEVRNSMTHLASLIGRSLECVQRKVECQSEILCTRKPTPGPETNFGAPTAPSKKRHGIGRSASSSSSRNWLNRPALPITSSQEIPKVLIWYLPVGNCWPDITSALVTSNIPHGGVCGPAPPPRFAMVDDGDTNSTSVVEELLALHALNKAATITSPPNPMTIFAIGR